LKRRAPPPKRSAKPPSPTPSEPAWPRTRRIGSAPQSEQERAALKEQLRQQLNLVLETRSTARGLIVNMNDVLFDTGKYTLRPATREKLSKIAGILLAHRP
jgi:outer membrane protein OmpA-like peptidoglycan-associated protein